MLAQTPGEELTAQSVEWTTVFSALSRERVVKCVIVDTLLMMTSAVSDHDQLCTHALLMCLNYY